MNLSNLTLRASVALLIGAISLPLTAQSATPAPHFVQQNGRHALLVDGAPYLILGAQINNSSSWPAVLPKVWPALEGMHVNTAEAPVYWEQIEPKPGQFDWTSVDAVLDGARAHHLHLVLLWFGTWKNGNDHYVPVWVKENPARFPRMMNGYGTSLDVLSANSPANLDADRSAFVALAHHLAERVGSQHTVLMIQVENESGAIGTVRDYSPEANKQFAGAVPEQLVKALGKKPGTWAEVFPGDADEVFQAWTQARYVNAIAEAGKHELNIPMYCNVWLAYPPAELPERRIPIPGIGYPSGGPVQKMIPLWKIAAPAIDTIGPDMYSSNPSFYLKTIDTYTRPDNPLLIPETGQGDDFAPFFFAALGRGAVGFAPFGVDWTGWGNPDRVPKAHAENYALIGSMDRTIAQLEFEGRVRTAIEVGGAAEQELVFAQNPQSEESGKTASEDNLLGGPLSLANATVPLSEAGTPDTRAADAAGDWIADVRFGFPQRDGQPAPGTTNHMGRVLIAQLGPNQFLLTGISASIRFHRPGFLSGIRMQILTAEEGYYTASNSPGAPEVWHTTRLLNGDQDDRGISFPDFDSTQTPTAVRITVGRF